MNQTLCILFVAVSCFSFGCSNEPIAKVAPPNAVAAMEAPQQEQKADGEGGIGIKIGSIVDQVKSKTPSVDDLKKMLNDTGNATTETTEDAMAWANKQYQTLKEQGKTHTGNVQDWLMEDWNNASAWEYQIIEASDPATFQEKLNEAGKQRWDCFHVNISATATTFYMKRQKKSYMKNLPLRDVLKLVPLVPLLDGQ